MAGPIPQPEQTEQKNAPVAPPPAAPLVAPATGRRAAFRDLKRQLADADLANPGLQKIILDELICAEEERDDLRLELKQSALNYHAADKQVGVLSEKLKSNKVNEIMFGVGLSVGGTVMGLTPFFWEIKPLYGVIALGLGLALTIGATIARTLFK